jgi:peptide/nickel transport system permease protein
MWKYIVYRLLWLVVILVCVAVLIFTVMYFVPGDPALIAKGTESTVEERYEWREQYGLNDSYPEQLGRYLFNTFLKFDMGKSFSTNMPVVGEFVKRLPRTLKLGLITVFINIIVGIPLGIVCALHRNTIIDYLLTVIAMLGMCMPAFWLALLMQQFFSLKLGWLPSNGVGTWRHWVMPVIAASISGIAGNVRQTRSAVLETIRADFITTARAKGVSKNSVIYKHMLPNALIPILSLMGGAFGHVISGTVIVETVFNFPGLGMYMLSGINARDYPVIRSCVLILAAFSAFVVLLVDLAYGMVDPRIKAQYVSFSKKSKKEVS